MNLQGDQNMEVVSLEIAKKLARRNLQKGQTAKMYQKESNCTVYNLKDNYKYATASYDAPNINELKRIIEHLDLSFSFTGIKDIEEYANKLIDFLKMHKISLKDVII